MDDPPLDVYCCLCVPEGLSLLEFSAKALWASAHLTDKLTVQNALFPEGILYRTDIGFFAPPDNEVAAIVFRTLISIAAEPDWEEIKSGRALLPILNRIALLRACTTHIPKPSPPSTD